MRDAHGSRFHRAQSSCVQRAATRALADLESCSVVAHHAVRQHAESQAASKNCAMSSRDDWHGKGAQPAKAIKQVD